MTALVALNVTASVATITLNRPEKLNAINDQMRSELIEALEHVGRDEGVGAVVLTGAGVGFCAGGDIAGMRSRMEAPAGETGYNGWKRQQQVHRQVTLLYNMPKPTIAAVNGAAAGLGADVALSCDFVIASTAASFAWSYIKRGLIPDGGGFYFLPRRVGLPTAKALIFSGRRVDAEEALSLGIADRLSSTDRLLADAQGWAAEFAASSRTALALGKAILNRSFEMPAEDVLREGSAAQGICYTSREHRESVIDFLNKVAEKK